MNCWTFTEFASINFLWCFWSLAPSNSCHHFSDDRQRTFFWMHFTACKRKDCAFICSMAENIFNIMLSFWKMSCLEYKGRRSMLHSYKVPILNHSLLLKPRNKWKAVFNPFGGFIKEFRGGSIMLTSCKWYKKYLFAPFKQSICSEKKSQTCMNSSSWHTFRDDATWAIFYTLIHFARAV